MIEIMVKPFMCVLFGFFLSGCQILSFSAHIILTSFEFDLAIDNRQTNRQTDR